MSTLGFLVARMAQRLGIEMPTIAGSTSLGLEGTIRERAPIGLVFVQKVLDGSPPDDDGNGGRGPFDAAEVVNALNSSDVWVWAESRAGDDGRGIWQWPRHGEEVPVPLTAVLSGQEPGRNVSIRIVAGRYVLRCVLGDRPTMLLVVGLAEANGDRPLATFHGKSLLVGSFAVGHNGAFNSLDFLTMVVRESVARVLVKPAKAAEIERREREFLTHARRHLEAQRNYAEETAPTAKYTVQSWSPLVLQTADGEVWPKVFRLPKSQVEFEREGDRPLWLKVLGNEAETDALEIDANLSPGDIAAEGVVRVRPNTMPLARMREALDRIVMGSHESHLVLRSLVTRPAAVEEMTGDEKDWDDVDDTENGPGGGALLTYARTYRQALLAQFEQPSPAPQVIAGRRQLQGRQKQAVELALSTPDIALIHGPPGTGKTTVICEIIQQLASQRKRVLLCAPTHVALDNVLEKIGGEEGITAIRLGAPHNVDEKVQRFLLQNRVSDLQLELVKKLMSAADAARTGGEAMASLQRELADRMARGDDAGKLLLLNANLVCATPIGVAMQAEFRNPDPAFDILIIDEASKATITDFLVPAARAKKWILVGDHRQLPPYADTGELEWVIGHRIMMSRINGVDAGEWAKDLAWLIRRAFDLRMHPDVEKRQGAWEDYLTALAAPMGRDDPIFEDMVELGMSPSQWRLAAKQGHEPEEQDAESSNGPTGTSLRSKILRLGAELLHMRQVAFPSVFEHLAQLKGDRIVRLDVQHRMHPSLAAYSSEVVYERDYPSAPETSRLGLDVPDFPEPNIWIDTAFVLPPERRYQSPRPTRKEWANPGAWGGGSYENHLEAEVAIELVRHFADWAALSWRGDPRRGTGAAAQPFEIGVICFYARQAMHVRDRLFGTKGGKWEREWPKRAANGAPIQIHVSIVDRFQGREKDFVILCTTRSNPAGSRGHVDNLNRLNVALTRARHKRIIIGDSSTLAFDPRRGQPKPRPEEDLLRRLHDSCPQRIQKWGKALGGAA